MIGGKRGVRIIEKTVKIDSIEPDLCELELGGLYEPKDDTCVIKLRIDESRPNEVDLISIKKKIV